MNFHVILLLPLFLIAESRLLDVDSQYKEDEIFDSYLNLTDIEEVPNVCDEYDNENCAAAWIHTLGIIRARNINRLSNVKFEYSTNINRETAMLKLEFQHQNSAVFRNVLTKVKKFRWRQFKSPQLRRIFQLLSPTIRSSDLSIQKQLFNVSMKIRKIYNHARPCFEHCLEEGEAGIVSLFRNERDYDKLAGFWSAWRDVTGRKIKDSFVERMHLLNIGAVENGYSDAASFSLSHNFEEENFNETVLGLYEEILPLYIELHGYVRYCLAKFYPNRFDKTGPIPAHIFGNVWAQQWNNILPILRSCRDDNFSFNMQEEANKNLQELSVQEMVMTAEEFYTSIGLYPMTRRFWERSIFEQQPGKLMDCHGTAFNFVNGVDYRIKMCAKQNLNDFTTIHHEMGHIEYFMAYRELPFAFRTSANPGFHEAIGDTIALAVKTPEHLKMIGLIPKIPESDNFYIDHLMSTALEKVAFLPFALAMDSYIWGVSNGSVPHNQLNSHWWNVLHRFQGIKPPVPRSENDFDPAAKYHIAFGREYIKYFVSFIHQFQFYEAMCDLSGHSGPLHRCDFYRSKAAGSKLLQMLAMGKSQHWRDTLKILTNSREITSKSLVRFFEPLYKWLRQTNKRLQIPIGW